MSTRIAKSIALLAAVTVALVLAACGTNQSSQQKAQNLSNGIQSQFEVSQPIPQYKWSQLRQNLIEIEAAESNGAQTTSFFFNLGQQDPIQSCPSIGFPIASTDELTSPDQATGLNNGGTGNTSIAQIDPNGIFQGESTGTYVECVNGNGSAYYEYWEGYVDTVTGPAVWDTATHVVKLTGPSSIKAQIGKG